MELLLHVQLVMYHHPVHVIHLVLNLVMFQHLFLLQKPMVKLLKHVNYVMIIRIQLKHVLYHQEKLPQLLLLYVNQDIIQDFLMILLLLLVIQYVYNVKVLGHGNLVLQLMLIQESLQHKKLVPQQLFQLHVQMDFMLVKLHVLHVHLLLVIVLIHVHLQVILLLKIKLVQHVDQEQVYVLVQLLQQNVLVQDLH